MRKIKSFNLFINEGISDKVSTSNYDMFNILKKIPYIKHVEEPTGHFLHSIDLSIADMEYYDDLNNMVNVNNWYIERGRGKRYTITQKYVKEALSTVPEKLYHITTKNNVDSILKNGILPKSDDIRHKYPPRIYVSDNIPTLKTLSKELKRWRGEDEYVILEIDTGELNIKLYKDTTSAYRGHYYIQDINNIPSKYIKIINEKS